MVGRPEGRLQRMGRRKRGRDGTDEKERGQEVKEGNGKNGGDRAVEDKPG